MAMERPREKARDRISKVSELNGKQRSGSKLSGAQVRKERQENFPRLFPVPLFFLCCVRNYEIARRGTQIALYMWLARYIHSFVWGGQEITAIPKCKSRQLNLNDFIATKVRQAKAMRRKRTNGRTCVWLAMNAKMNAKSKRTKNIISAYSSRYGTHTKTL